MEKWKTIEGYPDYMVSSMGRIRSLDRYVNNNGGLEYREGKILKSHKNNKGYLLVGLSKDGKVKKYLVHRLVAQAFIPNPDNLPEVNHKDENPQNNCVENIEYCDRSYNCNYGTHNERMAKTLSIPVLQFSLDGKFIRKWSGLTEAERELGIKKSSISKCCKGKQKTAYNHIWMYAKVGVFDIDINKLKKVA